MGNIYPKKKRENAKEVVLCFKQKVSPKLMYNIAKFQCKEIGGKLTVYRNLFLKCPKWSEFRVGNSESIHT